MGNQSKKIYQFKITLKRTKPPIWRRIQVPGDYTFWGLHVAIQDAMGWTDSHLHEFEVYNSRKHCVESIGFPDEEFSIIRETLPAWEIPLGRYFTSLNRQAEYTYDFGDGWEHSVVLEKKVQPVDGASYPRCLAGRRRCPPEDCGGPWGYQEFLEILADPKHERHEEILEWISGVYDPDDFEVAAVVFDSPEERLKFALGDPA